MRFNRVLWAVQGLLALLFLFMGGMKLILPGLFRIRTGLTPLAAAGLVIIMIGAAVTTAVGGEVLPTLLPVIVGGLAAFVAYGRAPGLDDRPRKAH